MAQPWSASSEAPGYMTTPQHPPRDANTTSSAAAISSTAPILQSPLQPSSRAAPRTADNDGDGDISMDDADPYKPKDPAARPQYQSRHSQQYLASDDSAAARRYSPMNMSPTSPYTSFSPQAHAQGQAQTQSQPQTQGLTHSQSTRQSPTRTNPYISPPSSYYSPPCTSSLSLLLSLRTTPPVVRCAASCPR